MKTFFVAVVVAVLMVESANAERSGLSFWVFKRDKLQTIMSGKGLDDPTVARGRIAECWGHFLGESCDMYLVEESVQFRLRAKIEDGTLDWGLWLYRGGENRSGGGRGTAKIADGWIFPPNWEKLEWVVLFRKYTTK